MRLERIVIVILVAAGVALAACKSEPKSAEKPAEQQAKPAEPPKQPPAATPEAPKAREGGPSVETCTKFADHLGTFVADSLTPPEADEEQKKYVAGVVAQDRDHRLRFCVEALEQAEVDCVLEAVDFAALSLCERHRRQVPADLAKRKEVTAEDCERFFVRYKQFMMTDGVPGDRVEADKDQVVRSCMEKAKPGTIACFITAKAYEEAKRCP